MIGKLEAYYLWREGEITPREAVEPVVHYLAEILERKVIIETEEASVRDMLSQIVAAHGEPMKAAGYKLELSAPSVTTTYPKADIDAFIMRLLEDGYSPYAAQLRGLAKTGMRSGSLRVTKDKKA